MKPLFASLRRRWRLTRCRACRHYTDWLHSTAPGTGTELLVLRLKRRHEREAHYR